MWTLHGSDSFAFSCGRPIYLIAVTIDHSLQVDLSKSPLSYSTSPHRCHYFSSRHFKLCRIPNGACRVRKIGKDCHYRPRRQAHKTPVAELFALAWTESITFWCPSNTTAVVFLWLIFWPQPESERSRAESTGSFIYVPCSTCSEFACKHLEGLHRLNHYSHFIYVCCYESVN